MFLMFMQQFSGINQVVFYLQAIFEKSGSTLDPGLSSFLTQLMQVFDLLIHLRRLVNTNNNTRTILAIVAARPSGESH